MADVNPIPSGYRSVSPYLGGGRRSRHRLPRPGVLGATERGRMPGSDGTIGHAELQLGDPVIMLADEAPDPASRSSGLSRTSSPAIAPGSLTTRSGTGGTSPPT